MIMTTPVVCTTTPMINKIWKDMTTDEEINFGSLVTSPSSFNLDFGQEKELPALNCVDLFPNPPKYIEGDQSSKEQTFTDFNVDSNESLPKSVENEQELINQFIDDENSNDSLDKFEKELETEKDHPEVTAEDIEKIAEQPEEIENFSESEKVKSGSEKSVSPQYSGLLESECATNQSTLQENSNSRISFSSEDKTDSHHSEEKQLPKTNASLPATSPSLSISSYYSSAESVSSSTSSSKKKKKKRHCYTCNIHFHHTHELLAHLKTHISLPAVKVAKLSDSDVKLQEYFQRQRELKESEESGGLKLKLKLSGSQNFQVVPINKPAPEKPKKGIRILTAKEIKQSPPHNSEIQPIDAMVAMSEMPMKPTEDAPMENRYFECPTLDGLDQYAEEVNKEAADDLLKKLLEGGQQIPQEADWSSNTNEFISIDNLAHMCTVCHSNFPDAVQLYEHRRATGHDIPNSMQPPPPPPQMMSQNNYRPRISFQSPPIPVVGFQQTNPQMTVLRPPYPTYGPQRYASIAPNYGQQPIVARRPPPLYRVPSPQSNSSINQSPFPEINAELYSVHNSNMMNAVNFQGNQHMPQAIRQPVFLKTRLQRAIRPKTPHLQTPSPNGTPSPPIVMAPPMSVRPRFLGPPYNGPPLKKIKREPDDDCEIVTQARVNGLPVIQSVQGGVTSAQNTPQDSDKLKESLQINEQITLSVKNKEMNKNPKEVASILANRGITVTHKTKQSASRENSPKSSTAQDAVQKLQLNNSVSIISKKRPEGSEDFPKLKTGDSSFISCPYTDCDEKFLTVEGLNRHTQRGHKMNKVNLRAFRCKMCPALFSTQDGLMDHQRKNHRMLKTSADELGIPIIDLRNEQTKQKLAALGIINYIPLSSKTANGCFGFPIVSVQGAANPNVCNMLGMGVNSLLSLGPIKPIPTRKTD